MKLILLGLLIVNASAQDQGFNSYPGYYQPREYPATPQPYIPFSYTKPIPKPESTRSVDYYKLQKDLEAKASKENLKK